QPQGSIRLMQGVAIPAYLGIRGKWSAGRGGIGVMTGNGQITQEESLARRHRVDPRKDAADGGRLVDAETRFALAANVAGIVQSLVAAIADDRFHAQVHEPAGMKEPSAIAGIRQHLSNAWRRDSLVIFRTGIESRPGCALNGKE